MIECLTLRASTCACVSPLVAAEKMNKFANCNTTSVNDSALLRRSCLFDARFYLSQYPDVAASGADPLNHYLVHGAAERRAPHVLFDANFYLDTNPDVASTGINPLVHYLREGATQRRDPHPLFDTVFYLANNPGVALEGATPLEHYISTGAFEGCDPHPRFDSAFYLRQVSRAGSEPINALIHYITDGARAELDPHPLFDTSFYVQQYPDVTENLENPLKHYVQHGVLEERLPRNFLLDNIAIASSFSLLREIEPLLPESGELSKFRVRKALKSSLTGDVYSKIAGSIDWEFTHLILVGDLSTGRDQFCQILDTLVRECGSDTVLVLAADPGDPGYEARSAVSERQVRMIGPEMFLDELIMHDRMLIAVRLILQGAPRVVYNFHSQLGSIIFSEYGQQLATVSALFDSSGTTVAGSLENPPQTQSSSERELLDPAAINSGDTTDSAKFFDISVIINCHMEGSVLVPTIRAVSLAAQKARDAGLSVELLLVADRADEATSQCLQEHLPSDARILETDLGDPGLARNAGIREARGEFVSLVDGDDLFDPGWLEASWSFAQTLPDKPFVLHPFGSISFGEIHMINLYFDSQDPDYHSTVLLEDTSWQSNPFARRSVYLQYPYRKTDLQIGFGFEDWLWNCDTIAGGVPHKLVADTFFCYRVKSPLVSRNANAHSCIMGPSRLFDLKFQAGA